VRAPYTQRFARGSGQNWHFVSLACQENFKQRREGDRPRVETKPGGRINHTQRFALRSRKPAGLPSIILCVYGHPYNKQRPPEPSINTSFAEEPLVFFSYPKPGRKFKRTHYITVIHKRCGARGGSAYHEYYKSIF
jgi:hypothetical protein